METSWAWPWPSPVLLAFYLLSSNQYHTSSTAYSILGFSQFAPPNFSKLLLETSSKVFLNWIFKCSHSNSLTPSTDFCVSHVPSIGTKYLTQLKEEKFVWLIISVGSVYDWLTPKQKQYSWRAQWGKVTHSMIARKQWEGRSQVDYTLQVTLPVNCPFHLCPTLYVRLLGDILHLNYNCIKAM